MSGIFKMSLTAHQTRLPLDKAKNGWKNECKINAVKALVRSDPLTVLQKIGKTHEYPQDWI